MIIMILRWFLFQQNDELYSHVNANFTINLLHFRFPDSHSLFPSPLQFHALVLSTLLLYGIVRGLMITLNRCEFIPWHFYRH